METNEEKNIISLFLRKRELEIQAVLLSKKLESARQEIAQNNKLIEQASIISEIYNDIPIKLVNLRQDSQNEELKRTFFVRLFPLFRRGKEGFYAANVCQRHDNRAHNITLFSEELMGGIYLPYRYTREDALILAKKWITIHILPERELTFVREVRGEINSGTTGKTETSDIKTNRRSYSQNTKILRPSQEPVNS